MQLTQGKVLYKGLVVLLCFLFVVSFNNRVPTSTYGIKQKKKRKEKYPVNGQCAHGERFGSTLYREKLSEMNRLTTIGWSCLRFVEVVTD